MNFSEYIQDQIEENTLLGLAILSIFVITFLVFFAFFLILVFSWPITIPIFIGTVFGYAYFKYKKDKKKNDL